VANSEDLDATAHPSFALTVQVTDNGSPQSSSSATVTVNVTANQAPTIANQTFSAIAGSANGTVVGTVAATGSAGQTLTYSFTGNVPDGFQINSSTGQITVSNSSALTLANSPFVFTVKVTDSNSKPLSSTATVTINLTANQSPTIANQSFQVAQNSAVGASVGFVAASAAGTGQTLTYAITGGNTGNAFHIDSFTGQITVNSNATLAANSPYALTVQVTDNNTTQLSNSATVTITAVAPNTAPVIANQTLTAVDGSPNGAIVGTVVASDPDAGQTLTYAITGGNVGNTFQINSATGQITIANNAKLNITSFPSFALTVQVTDNGVPALSNAATVTINLVANNPPTIANQTFSVAHGSNVGTLVGAVVASDPDPSQTVTYAITGGNTNNTFQIDPNTGNITVANNSGLTTANSPFLLTVKVTDDDARPLSSSATVTVNVT
jgi:hypothetical protein